MLIASMQKYNWLLYVDFTSIISFGSFVYMSWNVLSI